MKYRTRPAEHICSLEELFTEHLGLNIPIVPQTSSYSNKHTFSQLLFSQNPNQYDDIDKIMSFSVFKDADIEWLKKDADSAQKPLYYLIHPILQARSLVFSFPTWQIRTFPETSSLFL